MLDLTAYRLVVVFFFTFLLLLLLDDLVEACFKRLISCAMFSVSTEKKNTDKKPTGKEKKIMMDFYFFLSWLFIRQFFSFLLFIFKNRRGVFFYFLHFMYIKERIIVFFLLKS